MTILIAKANEPIFKKFYPKAEFKESSTNTSTFEITSFRYKFLYQTIKANGYNPYALMTIIN